MSAKYRFVMKLYPPHYRTVHGAEIAETAASLSPQGWSPRQSASLAVAGLRARALVTSQGSAKNVWGQAVLAAFGIYHAMGVVTLAAYVLGINGDVTIIGPDPRFVLVLVSVLLISLTLRVRTWTVILLIGFLVASLFIADLHISGIDLAAATAASIVGLLWVARGTQVTRAFSIRTAIVLVSVGVAAAWITNEPSSPWIFAAFGLATVAGLGLLRVDPRPLATAAALVAWILTFNAAMGLGSRLDAPLEALPYFGIHILIVAMLGFAAQHGISRLHLQTAPNTSSRPYSLQDSGEGVEP